MRGRLITLVIIAAVTVCAYAFATTFSGDIDAPEPVFHATLADPALYENGVYARTVELAAGTHELRFVPNGDSPPRLTVTVGGDGLTAFSETFLLTSERQGTEAAEYYTWDYTGHRALEVAAAGSLTVTVDPNGSVNGSVSVSLYKKP